MLEKYICTLLIIPSKDIPGQWTGICLEYDIWSTGQSIADTLSMVKEAILICLEDCELSAFEKADLEFWEIADSIITTCPSLKGVVNTIYLYRKNNVWGIQNENFMHF